MDSKKRYRFSKKIICIVATLAMVVAMMPMSAFATTEGIPITEVKITSLDTPVVGASVNIKDVTVETTPAEEEIFAVRASGWYDETIGAWADGVFRAGREYSLRLVLTAKLDYCFEEEGADQCQVHANFDESHSISASSQGSYTLTVTGKPVQAATPVTGVRIMDVQTPVPGLSCSTELINIAYSPENGLGSWNFEWYDETTKEVKSATDTFEKGHMYSLRFKATADEGYGFKFDENSAYTGKVTVNGLPVSEAVKSKEDTDTIVGKSGSFIAQPLKAPESVSVKLCGYDDIKASWSKATGATGYKVYFKKSTASSYTYKGTTTGTYKSLKNLTDGAKYFVKVVPYATAAGKTVTGPAKVSSGIYTLKKLNTPKVNKYSSSKVKVTWNNIAGESGYQISRSTKKTGTNVVSTYATTSGKYKVLKTTKNKTYYYKVRAYKTVDGKKICGPWSSVKSYKLK